MKQNHVIDPTWFYDAIEEFAFDYDWFYEGDFQINDLGEKTTSYVRDSIHGSLQSQGTSLKQSKDGNTEDMTYEFYCKSSYRIKIGDFILYKNRWLHVDSVRDFDEWGVRSCKLTMVNLNNYKDLLETVKYLQGLELV